jgi:hypothetical protein
MFPNVREAKIPTRDAVVAVGQAREEQFRSALDSYMRSYRASQHHAAGRNTDHVAARILQFVVRLLLGPRTEVRDQNGLPASKPNLRPAGSFDAAACDAHRIHDGRRLDRIVELAARR